MHSPLFIISLMITFFLQLPPGPATAGKIHHHHHHHRRRILHQPLFPVNQSVSPTSVPTITKPPTPKQFFPINLSPPPSPPPPPPRSDSDKTFPANISSLILPQSKSKPSTNKPISGKLIAIIISVSILSASLISAIFAFVFLRRHDRGHGGDVIYHQKFDSLRLVPPNSTPSHAEINKTTPYSVPRHESSSTSSDFLYFNTHVSSREVNNEYIAQSSTTPNDSVSINFNRVGIGSPELRPLPPLPRQHSRRSREVGEVVGSSEDDGEEEFFSPRGSSGSKGSPDFKNRSFHAPFEDNRISCSKSNSPTDSALNSPLVTSNSPESLVNLPRERRGLSSFDSSVQIQESHTGKTGGSGGYVSVKLPPSPPPPPPWRFWETPIILKPSTAENDGPSELVKPLRPVLCQNANGISNSSEGVEWRNEECMKPKLKPLHWDKVRASSDRAMVWDQLKSSSFQLNEEMIETLFTVNSSTLNSKDVVMPPIIPMMNQENQVLDPKKSQNIAILLRALSVSTVEVCEALLEGNANKLGTQLLESLIKMAPTKEEEWKLKDFKDESPFKLGTAEKFLKAVLDIPFAFKRVDAMLYIANFDSEVEYLKMSFKTLKSACEELRNSTKFLKLLQAVLKAGNRMNDGTNRGDACAFKLDTLLKLVHIKGADGKTTLLHFVVQEIIRAEECRLSGADLNPDVKNNQQSILHDDAEFRKIGVQVVSGINLELTNVKKAAAIDSDILRNEVAKLAAGVAMVMDARKLNDEAVLNESSRKFSNSMNDFLKKAEEELMDIQAQEGVALSMVKELTEYFHGGLAKEEARPLRIFMIVRDFLSILDRVCKDVENIANRTLVSSARHFPLPLSAALPQVSSVYSVRKQDNSSEDEILFPS